MTGQDGRCPGRRCDPSLLWGRGRGPLEGLSPALPLGGDAEKGLGSLPQEPPEGVRAGGLVSRSLASVGLARVQGAGWTSGGVEGLWGSREGGCRALEELG